MKTLAGALAMLVTLVLGQEQGQPYQFRLLNDILNKETYDPRVRPVRNIKRPVHVRLKLALYQIVDVIEPKQTVTLKAWVTQYWRDEYLGWNPVMYGDLDEIMLPWPQVWTPDTYLYNSLEMDQSESERLMQVIVQTNTSASRPFGQLTWQYPARYSFSGINYTTFGDEVELDNYIEHEEWKLLYFIWHRKETKYSCCVNAYVMLEATMVIQRKPLFYLVNLILPTFIISIVSMFGFFVPAGPDGERTEKVNLGITTLMAMVILLLMVVEQMPSTSDLIPLMGWFYLLVILLISAGTLTTVGIIWLQGKAEYGIRASRCFAAPIIAIGKFICIPVHPSLKKEWSTRKPVGFINVTSTGNGAFDPTSDDSELKCTDSMIPYELNDSTTVKRCTRCGNTGTHDDEDYENTIILKLEWQYIADTLDRLCLIGYLTVLILLTAGVMVIGNMAQDLNFSLWGLTIEGINSTRIAANMDRVTIE